MAENKPGAYAYVTGYASNPAIKKLGSHDCAQVRLNVPGYRDDDPDEVYHVRGWKGMVDEVMKVKGGSLVKVSGYLKQISWTDNRGGARFAVEITAKRVDVLEASSPDDFDDDDIGF